MDDVALDPHPSTLLAEPTPTAKPANMTVAPLGVTLLLAAVYSPVPTALTAATRKTYPVPLVSPVTVALVAADVPSANVVHVDPLLLENCTA